MKLEDLIRSAANVATSATNAAAVDLSAVDKTFDSPTRGLWIGTGGDVSVQFALGGRAVLAGVPDGTLLPVAVTTVIRATTTAANIVALF